MNAALDYAENHLGVHRVYDEAEALLKEHDEAMSALDSAIDARRKLDDAIEDRQMDILIAERGQHSDLTQAALDRRIKEKQHTDEALKRLKSERNAKAGEASGLELDARHLEYRLKVKVARMEELAGYFQYLAAVKQASFMTPASEASAPASVQAAGGEAYETNATGETQ